MKGFEPLTPSLPWKCSTPELHWQTFLYQLIYFHKTGFDVAPKPTILKTLETSVIERETRLEPATLSLEG